MGFFALWQKTTRKLKSLFKGEGYCQNRDDIHLSLDGLEIDLTRCFSYDKPHEVTVVVPRAELRKKVTRDDVTEEIEVLLNSITVVHSPQRPSDEGEGPPPEPPEIPRRTLSRKRNMHNA